MKTSSLSRGWLTCLRALLLHRLKKTLSPLNSQAMSLPLPHFAVLPSLDRQRVIHRNDDSPGLSFFLRSIFSSSCVWWWSFKESFFSYYYPVPFLSPLMFLSESSLRLKGDSLRFLEEDTRRCTREAVVDQGIQESFFSEEDLLEKILETQRVILRRL